MYLNFVTGNVLQKFAKSKKNIIFFPQNNLFDHSLFELSNNYYIFNDNNTNYGIPNVIDLTKSYTALYNYNLSITNNIIGYSTSNIKKFHINSIIFTHSYRPPFIKKEDASILNNNLTNEYKVFFSPGAHDSWSMKNKSVVIKYGIPKAFMILDQNTRQKDILILNFDKAVHNEQLKNVLQSNNYDCDTLDSCQTNVENLNSIFNQYKICIDLAEHNICNLLCSIASGCEAITLTTAMTANDYSHVSGIHLAESPADILPLVRTLLSNKADITYNSTKIKESFDFDIFSQTVNNLIDKTNMEAFIL